MMRHATVTLPCLAGILAAGLVTGGALRAADTMESKAVEGAAAKSDAPSKLDLIKKLTGDWVEVGQDGKPTDKVVSTYRVTAGGSAVEETLMRGTDHEMVTVYNMDGDVLMLTHYCVAGNQPRMKAEKQTDPHKLVFHCAGATNMKSENDQHMHQATIVWKDDNHIHSEWEMVKDGKNVMTASFDLARK
jgi:hypothetical protein